MSTFPENNIEILRDYFTNLKEIREELKRIIVLKILDRRENKKAIEINKARQNLQKLLSNSSFFIFKKGLTRSLEDDGTRGIHELIKHREFDSAIEEIDKLVNLNPASQIPLITGQSIKAALTGSAIKYIDVVEIDDPFDEPRHQPPFDPHGGGGGFPRARPVGTGKPPKKIDITLKLRGYKGPKLTGELIQKLIELRELITGGSDKIFRLGLLRAECLLGKAKAPQQGESPEEFYNDAIAEYAKLLPKSNVTVLDPVVFSERSGSVTFGKIKSVIDKIVISIPFTTTQKFVAIRAAFAHLSLGDFLFRRAFRFNEEERKEVLKVYKAVLTLMNSSNISLENNVRNEITDYANIQIAKLGNGFNFLGYRDSFVPDAGLLTLRDLTQARINAAVSAVEKFNGFKTRADALAQELAQMTQEQLEQQMGVGIAALREGNAKDRRQNAIDKKELLEDKEKFLDIDFAAGVGILVVKTIASLGAGAAGGAGGAIKGAAGHGPGAISSAIGYAAAKNELEHQIRIAQTEFEIAGRDVLIANLEKRIAESRLAFIQEMIAAKKSGSFNTDRFFALANAFEEMARRHLDVALEFLYLYERAISFRRLKSLQLVEAEVVDSDILIAPSSLAEKLAELDEEAKSDGKGQDGFPLPGWSLRTRYPIEFSQFLQTGKMEFVISLYDVEKIMGLKGHGNIRIKKINPEVVGLIPSTGFIGTLIHRGTMLFRDKNSTLSLDPNQDSFIPSGEQVEEAMAELESGKLDRAVAGGVELVATDQDALRFSSEGVSVPTDTEKEFDLAPIENYGLTGTWLLKTEGLNLRAISDIQLKFIVSLEELDPDLESQVGQLIKSFEEGLTDGEGLDEVTAFSMRQRFFDAFEQLQDGEASITVDEDDFPSDKKDMKVKTVILQATDEEGKGVKGLEVEIVREDEPFALTRTTADDGFTEDVNVEIPVLDKEERFSVFGEWKLRLANPDLLEQVNDISWFFLYEFKSLGEES